MANISIYDPLSARLGRLFSHFPFAPSGSLDGWDTVPEMNLKLDVSEDDKSYMVQADLPGVRKEDIRVTVNGNQVSISAETHSTRKEKGKNLICNERYEGKVFRSFSLDSDVDESKTEAHFSDGVLHLTLPKLSESVQKQIKVQ